MYRTQSECRQDYYASLANHNRNEWLAGYIIVLDTVHPVNLGELPPSPKVLQKKMAWLGLTPDIRYPA